MIKEIMFDYDNDIWSGRKALRLGLKLIKFAILKGLKLNIPEEFSELCDNYGLHLVMMNKLIGIKTIVGIRDTLEKDIFIERLRLIDPEIEIKSHIHIGNNNDKDKQRIWIPPIAQSKLMWKFEDRYCDKGKAIMLSTDIPLFHFDNPEHFSKYIEFLYMRKIDAKNDLEIIEVKEER